MSIQKWVVREADKDIASDLSEKFNIDPFVAFMLVSRGISKDVDVADFLSDDFVIPSPFDFVDMDEAVFTIGDAIDNGLKICVYGDYDCDGVTSTVLLVDYFRSCGADVCYYIPDRITEGYGLNKDAIDSIKSQGVDLIVTVDNGISSVDEAEYIYSLGMSLVITDHHQLPEGNLPRAEAVVNPHRTENNLDFREFCGVAVAFMLCMALNEDEGTDIVDRYIDLVAIGTIADVMPLKYANRSFVKRGLQIINNNPRRAFKPLLSSAYDKELTSTELAFQICPRINAMGRMGDAKRAVEWLLCDNEEQTTSYCNELNEENIHRQQVEGDILSDVKNQIALNPSLVNAPVIVVAGKNYHLGVIGIVSAHITEEYGKPSFVIGIDDKGIAKGSARSVDGFDVFEALNYCKDDLIKFGGHPLAAGVTLNVDMIDKFRDDINSFALEKYPRMPQSELLLDFKLSPTYLNVDLLNSLSVLEPYGAGNQQAVFGIYKMTITGITPLKEGKHIRLQLQKNNTSFNAVKFSTPYDTFPYKCGDVVNIAVKLSKNIFRNRVNLSVRIVDIRLSTFDEEKYFNEKAEYDLYEYKNIGKPSLYPAREESGYVYRYLRNNNGFTGSDEELYFRLQNKVTFGKLKMSLTAFEQSGLISRNGSISLCQPKDKVSLDDTEVLKKLRGRINSESGN